jgi:glycosyltransferase involved in cell wall biosynthesis
MGRAVRANRDRLREKDLLLAIFGEHSDLKFWLFSSAASLAQPYALLIGCRTFEDHTRESLFKDLRNRYYRRWMNGARGILADGEDIRRELAAHGVDVSKVRVMYAAIDSGRYHPGISPEPFWRLLEERGIERRTGPLLLYCGRLLFMNRPLDFPRIVERVPDCWAVVIGDGPDRAEMEELAAKTKGRVSFLGYQSESILAAAFRAADLCLFPLSRMIAGISLVVPKAMAAARR